MCPGQANFEPTNQRTLIEDHQLLQFEQFLASRGYQRTKRVTDPVGGGRKNVVYQARDAPKGMLGARNPWSINLSEHPRLSWGETL
jgi:hypothetical protein